MDLSLASKVLAAHVAHISVTSKLVPSTLMHTQNKCVCVTRCFTDCSGHCPSTKERACRESSQYASLLYLTNWIQICHCQTPDTF